MTKFFAIAGLLLTLGLAFTASAVPIVGVYIDDFVLNGQVFPEPTTALLLTLGLTGLGRFGNKAPPLAP